MSNELTPRQRAVLNQLVRGRTESEVASRLRISPHTVHSHVKKIYRHFGVKRRAKLLARVLGG